VYGGTRTTSDLMLHHLEMLQRGKLAAQHCSCAILLSRAGPVLGKAAAAGRVHKLKRTSLKGYHPHLLIIFNSYQSTLRCKKGQRSGGCVDSAVPAAHQGPRVRTDAGSSIPGLSVCNRKVHARNPALQHGQAAALPSI
jgi:hypothetical protein